MRFGNFSLLIPEGREVNTGHVEIGHGTVYTLRLSNHDHSRACDAVVTVDGKDMGGYRLRPGQSYTLERPYHDTGRFTFFRAGSTDAINAGEKSISEDNRGLVSVTFKPEKLRKRNVYRGGPCGQSVRGGGYEREELCSGGIELTSLRCAAPGTKETSLDFAPGITGLTGTSAQQFVQVADLDYDQSLEVTINLRLVAGNAVRELAPAKRGNDVPPPV